VAPPIRGGPQLSRENRKERGKKKKAPKFLRGVNTTGEAQKGPKNPGSKRETL